jgi:hypothetical protein
LGWFSVIVEVLSSLLKNGAALQLENIALRHQIGVLQRSAKKRLQLHNADRLFWVGLSQVWSEWRSTLVIVKPGTVIAWHRKASRLFWTWKVRHGKPGRPAVSPELRALIRRISRENSGWGAPRIHGELLKLGIDIGDTSVSKYLVRRRKPPSQTWRTFLQNDEQSLVSIDSSPSRLFTFRFCMCSWCWRMNVGASFTLRSQRILRLSGPLTNFGRPSRAKLHPAICCAIETVSSAMSSWIS